MPVNRLEFGLYQLSTNKFFNQIFENEQCHSDNILLWFNKNIEYNIMYYLVYKKEINATVLCTFGDIVK